MIDARSAMSVDLDAVANNVAFLRAASPGAELCAVVKADGYGHGAATIARACIDAGASMLAVAQLGEAAALRDGGIDAPIWLLAEPLDVAACEDLGVEPFVYSSAAIESAARAGLPRVHLHVDTGMARVGCQPSEAVALAAQATDAGIDFGLSTHFACADEPEHPANAQQLRRFEAVRAELAATGLQPSMVHCANTAATLTNPAAHYDAVRCGIGLYGLAPSPTVNPRGFMPALRWSSSVSWVKNVAAGTGVGYGHQGATNGATTLATVPVGYADGIPRRLWRSGHVLVRGRRCPLVGVVTMDQIVVDVGVGGAEIGDEVMLIGQQEQQTVTVSDWARWTDTITYEITCGIAARAVRQ